MIGTDFVASDTINHVPVEVKEGEHLMSDGKNTEEKKSPKKKKKSSNKKMKPSTKKTSKTELSEEKVMEDLEPPSPVSRRDDSIHSPASSTKKKNLSNNPPLKSPRTKRKKKSKNTEKAASRTEEGKTVNTVRQARATRDLTANFSSSSSSSEDSDMIPGARYVSNPSASRGSRPSRKNKKKNRRDEEREEEEKEEEASAGMGDTGYGNHQSSRTTTILEASLVEESNHNVDEVIDQVMERVRQQLRREQEPAAVVAVVQVNDGSDEGVGGHNDEDKGINCGIFRLPWCVFWAIIGCSLIIVAVVVTAVVMQDSILQTTTPTTPVATIRSILPTSPTTLPPSPSHVEIPIVSPTDAPSNTQIQPPTTLPPASTTPPPAPTTPPPAPLTPSPGEFCENTFGAGGLSNGINIKGTWGPQTFDECRNNRYDKLHIEWRYTHNINNDDADYPYEVFINDVSQGERRGSSFGSEGPYTNSPGLPIKFDCHAGLNWCRGSLHVIQFECEPGRVVDESLCP